MDRHRSKSSKRRSHAIPAAGSRNNDSLPVSHSDDPSTKSVLAFPQRESRSARGDPLHPFVALVKTFNEFLFELDADGKFLSIWTSNEALLRERRAEFPAGRRWFQARVSAVGRGATKSHSVCLLARDITQRRLAEDALRQQEALLMHAEQVTGTGCWEYNVETRQRVWSNQVFRLYGFDPKNGVPSEETMFAMIHPDDRERVRGSLYSAIERCSPFESEGRYNLPDGRQRIIFIRGIALPGHTGKTARLLAVVQDVTEIRGAEAQDRQR